MRADDCKFGRRVVFHVCRRLSVQEESFISCMAMISCLGGEFLFMCADACLFGRRVSFFLSCVPTLVRLGGEFSSTCADACLFGRKLFLSCMPMLVKLWCVCVCVVGERVGPYFSFMCTDACQFKRIPSGHMTFIQRHINVDTPCDVESALYERHMTFI